MGFHERVLRTQENIQLTYELPHRVNAAVSFLTLSSNGSNVLIYAHESGIRIIWRGGRKFAPPKSPTNGNTKASAPASANDSIMIIDSSDDEPEPPKAPVYEVTFEEHEPELDAANQFPAVLTYIDILFGTEATALACCEKVAGKIVVAAACADNTVRLVTLPLTPPGPEQSAAAESKKAGKWNETIHILTGHSTPPNLIAITHQAATKSTPGSLLIASHSRDVTGKLLLHTHPLSTHAAPPVAAQIQHLPTPASSLAFHPSTSTLLVGFPSGCIRLFSPSSGGAWLLTLHTPFAAPSPTSSHPFRKPVLDAKYVLTGGAIAVLLADGEWGIWDIGGAGPEASKTSILKPSGIRGGAVTMFSIGGSVDGLPAKSSSKSSSAVAGKAQSRFAPMTPATRKTVDVAAGFRSAGAGGGCATRGAIAVVPLEGDAVGDAPDDRVAFWVEDSFVVIHSLRGFWAGKTARGGGLFAAAQGRGRVQKVEGVSLRGESCGGMVIGGGGGGGGAHDGEEMVVVGEHRILFVRDRRDAVAARGREMGGEEECEGGLDGLDRSLERMERSRVAGGSGRGLGQSFGSVGSAFAGSRGSAFGESFGSWDSRA